MKSFLFAGLLVLTATVTYGQSRTPWNQQSYQNASGVVINGQMLSVQEAHQLNYILGFQLPKGRYAVDAYGNFGIEGRKPIINIVQYIQARMQQVQLPNQNSRGGEVFHRSWFPDGDTYYSRGANGESAMMIGGCTVINGDLSC